MGSRLKRHHTYGDGSEGLRRRMPSSRKTYSVSKSRPKGVFHAAWWPSILNGLKVCGCPKNIYNLTKSYFSQRTAMLSTNNFMMKKEICKGFCCGPGFWYIPYNCLLNLKFTRRTKAVALAAIRKEKQLTK